jgi:Ni/Fe-hydrogenase 1 B-type cytochrome subunit
LSNSTGTTFNEVHSRVIRIWHWLFFVLISSAIITVVLATFVFNTRQNIPLVQDQLQRNGISADVQAARAVSHAFNDKLWELHTWIGYFIAAFVLGRFLLEIFQPGEERLSVKIRLAMGFVPASPEQGKEKRHYLLVKWSYLLFYLLILVMALTGLGLALEDVPFFRAARRGIKSVHSFTQYLIYAFVLLHISGVIVAEVSRYPGIISGMINGKRRNKSF